MEAPYSSYTIKKLQDDRERITGWLADEERRMNETSDEHLKGLLKVRVGMHQRNIEELTKAIQTFESQRADKETV